MDSVDNVTQRELSLAKMLIRSASARIERPSDVGLTATELAAQTSLPYGFGCVSCAKQRKP